jgi:hypothetical protein
MVFVRTLTKALVAVVAAGTVLGLAGAPASARTPTAPHTNEIVGHWVSPGCETVTVNGSTAYQKRRMHLGGAHWRITVTPFADAACTQPLFNFTISGRYRLGAPLPLAGAREADFEFARIVAVAHTASMAAAFEAAGCGTGPWTVGVPQDISATGCLGVPSVTACPVEYDLVQRDGALLRFGRRDVNLCAQRAQAISELGLVRVHGWSW